LLKLLFHDPLGAFVQAKFPGKTHEFESLVRQGLAGKATTKVVVGANTIEVYALGTTVYLDRPLNDGHRMLLAAATTEQEGAALRGDVAALFAIVREANRVARNNHLQQIVLPVIGAGHGSICGQHALIVQLLAWSELLYSNPGQSLAVRIVVFRADTKARPEIAMKAIEKLLIVATASCSHRQEE
jgi:hypothetical protein